MVEQTKTEEAQGEEKGLKSENVGKAGVQSPTVEEKDSEEQAEEKVFT